MSRVKSPCYKCESRHSGCHSECELYAHFQRENAMERNLINTERTRQAAVTNYIVTATIKHQKQKNK